MNPQRNLKKAILIAATCGLCSMNAQAVETPSGPHPSLTSPWTQWSWTWTEVSQMLPTFLQNQLQDLKGFALVDTAHEWLNAFALKDTTSEAEYAAMNANIHCGPETLTARTANGTCNDLSNPAMGAAGIRFGRNMKDIQRSIPDTKNLLNPNPRLISQKLLTRSTFKEVPFLNLLAASWIQFMTHDWFSHGDNEIAMPYIVPAPDADSSSLLSFSFTKNMIIPRTQVDTTRTSLDDQRPPTYRNENTHWFDGSQLYGNDLETQLKLRATLPNGEKSCKFDLTADDHIPLDTDNVEKTGFKRNWWLGLSMLHHLFVLEHNYVCDYLKTEVKDKLVGTPQYADWTEQKLFDTSRLIVAAIIAKIHTLEWTPSILPNPTLNEGMHINWTGSSDVNNEAVKPNAFTHILGFVDNSKDLHGVPYTLTEEFVSVYRMHSLLPETLRLSRLGAPNQVEEVSIADTRDENSHLYTNKYALQDLFYSFGTAHPGALTLNNFPRFLQDLKIVPIRGVPFNNMDLGAIDILRDRERGVPRYNEFRRQVHLTPIKQFEDLFDMSNLSTENRQQLANLKSIYNNNVEMLDLLVGCLAEQYRPKYFGFGETQFQIFLVMATRRLQADRFFTTDYNAATYTQVGLDYIDDATMEKVILRHFPQLQAAMAGIQTYNGVRTAFNPWAAVQ